MIRSVAAIVVLAAVLIGGFFIAATRQLANETWPDW